MARVFVSSTYQDLKDCREQVGAGLRRMGHEDIAMENFVAEDRRSLDTCLELVTASDLYAGLFAWRYGYVPDGFEESITALEYRRAVECGIECIILLLQDDAPWAIQHVDNPRDRIEAFRNELKAAHTPSYFTSEQDIEARLTQAVARWDRAQSGGMSGGASDGSAPINALHQIPAPPADFTGREAELQELLSAIQRAGVTISGLRGMGGIGKTALAFKLAAELEDRYPDAQIYLDLHGASEQQPLSPADAMAHVVRAFEPAAQLPNDDAGLAPLYQSTLHGKRVLLLMDNASGADQVQPLIPPAGCALLVTSRQRFTLPGLFARDLDTLPPDDARNLLLAIAPRIGDSADGIAGLCGNLPHALRLAASALAERPDLAIEDYVERLIASPLDERVEASLALSYDLFDPESQARWRALAVFPETFDAAAAAALWAIEQPAAQDTLGTLLRYSMVEWNDATRRYRLHDLARVFADGRLAGDERLEAGRRHSEHYVSVLAQSDNLYLEGGESLMDGLALFDLERVNVAAGQCWASTRAEADASAAQLCSVYANAGPSVLDLRLHPRRKIAWLEIGLYASRRLSDRSAESSHIGNLGSAYSELGEPRRAMEYYEQGLVISREIGDRRAEANELGGLGNGYLDLGALRRAAEYYEKALVISREIGDRRAEGNALTGLGNAYMALHEPRKAIEQFEQHLDISRDIGDRRAEGGALTGLGLAWAVHGEMQRAIEHYQHSLEIARDIGDRQAEGGALGNIANALYQLGERDGAIKMHQDALAIFEAIEDPLADLARETLARWQREAD